MPNRDIKPPPPLQPTNRLVAMPPTTTDVKGKGGEQATVTIPVSTGIRVPTTAGEIQTKNKRDRGGRI